MVDKVASKYFNRAKNFFSGKEVTFKDEEDKNTKAHLEFRAATPLKTATFGVEKPRTFKYFEVGDTNPVHLICIPPAGGSADIFFKLITQLPEKGIRVTAVQIPEVDSVKDWIDSFTLFLDHLKAKKVHLLGHGLGGYLSILYMRTHNERVLSLFLINSYASNAAFAQSTTKFKVAVPIILRNYLARNMQREKGSQANLASVRFFEQHMDDLTHAELVSNLDLESGEDSTNKRVINPERVTIVEANDFLSIPPPAVASLKEAFPAARYVPLKKGGDFPYIADSEEVVLHIVVHLRRQDQALLAQASNASEPASASTSKPQANDASPTDGGEDETAASSSSSSSEAL